MDLNFRASTPADVQEICDVFFDAFAEDVLVRRIFLAESKSARLYWLQNIGDAMQNPDTHFVVVTDPSSSTPERLLAFAQWIAPVTKRDEPRRQYPWPEGADTTFAEALFGAGSRKHDELMADRPHWYLRTIGVRKEAQGKAIGGRLIKWGLERADAAGLEVYLAANPTGASIYRRYGFENTESVVFDGGYMHFFMFRKPSDVVSG